MGIDCSHSTAGFLPGGCRISSFCIYRAICALNTKIAKTHCAQSVKYALRAMRKNAYSAVYAFWPKTHIAHNLHKTTKTRHGAQYTPVHVKEGDRCGSPGICICKFLILYCF
jgi:hypothetical protein